MSDVLVQWKNGSKNIVSSNELVCVNQAKTISQGCKVKMLYKRRWYFGKVLATEEITENEDSHHYSDEDDKPLATLRKTEVDTDNQVTLETKEARPDLCLMNGDTEPHPKIIIISDITLVSQASPGPIDEYTTGIESPENQIMSSHASSARPESFSESQRRLQEISLNVHGELNNSITDEECNDDDVADPDYTEDCAMRKCSKKGYGFCGCGYWMCRTHFFSTLNCTIHGCVYDSDMEPMEATKKKTETLESKYYDGEQHCDCENCENEVFSSCHRCLALLCWTHFSDDYVDCNLHTKTVTQPIEQKKGEEKTKSSEEHEIEEVSENREKRTKPEEFEVEGSGREVEPTRKITKSQLLQDAKQRSLSGKDYIIPNTMNLVPPKAVRSVCQSSYCRKFGRKCHIFTDDQRTEILTAFYELGALNLQREYICRYVDKKNPKTQKNSSRKQNTNKFFLPYFGDKVSVCKVFFLSTLNISEKFMRTALKKLHTTGVLEGDLRGGRTQKHMQRDQKINEDIRSHMKRFPRVESHYCRKNSSREYLSSDLSLIKMYSLYLEDHKNSEVGSITTYRKIFRSMNLSFHHPKKDQCSLCKTYRDGDESVKTRLHATFSKHEKEKDEARRIKKESKDKALLSNKFVSAVFDLQQVIHLPISSESAIFYKQRLAFYNFTVYNLSTRDCHCFTWYETISKRGASEIATCVYLFLQKCDEEGVEIVEFFSDGCYGQNKNSIIPAMYLYFLNTSRSVVEIRHHFFETCHGQNEGDSAHSAISKAISKAGDLFVPAQIVPIIRLSRKKHPYIVYEMNFSDFLDFKKVSQDLRILSIRKSDESDQNMNWTKISSIKVEKQHSNQIFFKTSHVEGNWRNISLQRNADIKQITIRALNNSRQKIPEKKYQSLVSLCEGTSPVIRISEYEFFYRNLPH